MQWFIGRCFYWVGFLATALIILLIIAMPLLLIAIGVKILWKDFIAL